jgi:sigma-B regulation protein RsbU (phosphoserine phosphatase)
VAAPRIEMLRNLPFLEGARPDVAEHLADEAVEKTFGAGETILEEGSTGREVYLIVEGVVEIIKGSGADAILLGERGSGQLVGEMALLEERPRFATVRARTPTRLLEFSEERMRSALAQQPRLLYQTVKILSARLRESDLQMIADLQRKNEQLDRAYRELQAAQAALVDKERLERELELAREIQQSILPRVFPHLPGVSCAARSRPARHVGGDFYDVIPLGKRRVGLLIADVSDKGMPAALFMALTRSLIRAEARRSSSPREVLLNVHRLLLEISQTGMFVTVFYGVLDLAQGGFCYARAGHDRPLHFRPSSGECRLLAGEGMLLGLVEPVILEEVEMDLGQGDRLVLYTDGITDTKSPTGEFFGVERLREIVCATGQQDAQSLCDLIFAEVEQFQAGSVQFDDMAVLVVSAAP